ncbi:MAG: hypothetical protein DLM55_11520 [Acidimicrobiales bacterium]|nr:MAG: hypothetical protein DLM55_11520 [Acidimicrobiales bacterium]
MTHVATRTYPSRVRRRRWPWVLLGVLVLLLVALIVVDRVAVSVADDKVATAVASSAAQYEVDPASTSVDIRGFPFLTQAAGGSFDRVDVTLRNVKAAEFRFARLHAQLTDVTVPRSVLTGQREAHDIVAGGVTASGDMDPAQLSSALNQPDLKLAAADGAIQATGTVTLRGVTVRIDAKLQPYLNGSRVALRVLTLRIDGREPSVLLRGAAESYLANGVAMPKLPFDAKLTDVTMSEGTVQLKGEARDVTLVK